MLRSLLPRRQPPVHDGKSATITAFLCGHLGTQQASLAPRVIEKSHFQHTLTTTPFPPLYHSPIKLLPLDSDDCVLHGKDGKDKKERCNEGVTRKGVSEPI